MPTNTPAPTVTPMLAYHDAAAASRWLAVPYVIDGVHVYVEDVDAHFTRARESGATILSEPADTGYGRSYRAADLEGHRWMFDQPA